ncbi:MAG TPA: M4 family metallopeptidase [Pyrinomonadaceae bacterium]
MQRPCGTAGTSNPCESSAPGAFQVPTNKDGKPKGWTKKFYHRDQGKEPPAWVERELKRSIAYLNGHGNKWGLLDAETELATVSAEEDDLGITHLRLDQVYKGVPVFGGQVVTHLDAKGVRGVDGHLYKEAHQVKTIPKLGSTEAIAAAKAALGYNGAFARQPTAELLILPNELKNEGPEDRSGARLVYKVEMLIEDGVQVPARWWYFVDAEDGSIVWRYDAMNQGAGQSLYNGYVVIPSGYYNGAEAAYDPYCGISYWRSGYWLWDGSGSYGYMETTDMHNSTGGADTFYGYEFVPEGTDNQWGITWNYSGTCGYVWRQRQQAAVDAQFGMMVTWDYFLYDQGRRGIDNLGYKMISRVHYGSNLDFAQWNGSNLTFGDGSAGRPFVALDTIAHEWTHGITARTSRLPTIGEAGAANESFSDIFGSMVEFKINSPVSPPDYYMGEDYGTPIRSVANPPAFGDPDHYNNRRYAGYCAPSSGNDFCGVHHNNGIQNKAFYLLAEGGTHPYSGVSVPGIGREAAARIFYRALTFFLTPTATLHDVRLATMNAALELYGYAYQGRAAAAWDAVGVPQNRIDESWFYAQQLYLDALKRGPDLNGWIHWSGYINGCGPRPNNNACLNSRRLTVARGFLESGEFRQNKPALANPGTPEYNQEYVRQCYDVFLHRAPDGSYYAWLDYVNNTGDYDGLVSGFINSSEYRLRFCCGG